MLLHIPAISYSCGPDGEVLPVNSVDAGFIADPGYTVIPIYGLRWGGVERIGSVYEAGEVFKGFPTPAVRQPPSLFADSILPEPFSLSDPIVQREPGNESLLVRHRLASRVSLPSKVSFNIVTRDPPFIFSTVELRANCDGVSSITTVSSSFPTTALYVDGVLISRAAQDNVALFVNQGGNQSAKEGRGDKNGRGYLDERCAYRVRVPGSATQLSRPLGAACLLAIVDSQEG